MRVDRGPIPRALRALTLLAAGALACGCKDTDLDLPPEAVFALFDPAAMPPAVPLPNDILMMPAAPSSVARSSFSGPVAPQSVTAAGVLVLDVTSMMPVPAEVRLDPNGTTLEIAPPQGGWPAQHRIAVILRGGATGLRGARGEPVVASPAFFFARSRTPLVHCPSAEAPAASCMSVTPLLPPAQAAGLEQLRVALAPLLAAVEGLGVPRDEIVLAWTFTIAVPTTDGGTASASPAARPEVRA